MHRYGLWRSSTIPSLESERGSQTPERAGSGSILEPLTRFSAGPSRSVPGYAFPFSEQTQRIQKRARPQPALTADRAYMLTPDGWESPRFSARFWLEAGSGKVVLSPPAHPQVTRPVGQQSKQFCFVTHW